MSDTNHDRVPPPPPPLPPAYAVAPPVASPMPYGTYVQESSWPKVIGIIAIVFAAIGIFGGLCGTVAWVGMSALQTSIQANPQAAQAGMPFLNEMGRYKTFSILSGLAGAGLQVVLLISAINLMRRRLWTVGALKIWAGLYMLFSFAVMIIGYSMQRDMYQRMLSAPGSQGQLPQFVSQASMGLGMLFSIVWYCTLPVFLLIWFSRAKIKAETATWS